APPPTLGTQRTIHGATADSASGLGGDGDGGACDGDGGAGDGAGGACDGAGGASFAKRALTSKSRKRPSAPRTHTAPGRTVPSQRAEATRIPAAKSSRTSSPNLACVCGCSPNTSERTTLPFVGELQASKSPP